MEFGCTPRIMVFPEIHISLTYNTYRYMFTYFDFWYLVQLYPYMYSWWNTGKWRLRDYTFCPIIQKISLFQQDHSRKHHFSVFQGCPLIYLVSSSVPSITVIQSFILMSPLAFNFLWMYWAPLILTKTIMHDQSRIGMTVQEEHWLNSNKTTTTTTVWWAKQHKSMRMSECLY